MFVKCEKLADFWIKVEELMNRYECRSHINFGVNTVLWNRVILTPVGHVRNLICLLAKQFIYRQRCLKEELKYVIFEKEVQKIQNIEMYYAKKNNRTNKHVKKWQLNDINVY